MVDLRHGFPAANLSRGPFARFAAMRGIGVPAVLLARLALSATIPALLAAAPIPEQFALRTADDCKFCQLLQPPGLEKRLPNLVVETPAAIVVVNRRPAAPGHLTIILKDHLAATSAMTDGSLGGIGSLLGRLSAMLEAKYHPRRVIFLADGKPTAHPHFHLIPESPERTFDLAAIMADLNQPVRPDGLSLTEMTRAAEEFRALLSAPAKNR